MAEPVSPEVDSNEKETNAASDVESPDEESVSAEFERNTMRLIDFRILPFLALVGALSFIDQGNLGIARVVGMGQDLGLLVGNRYSIVSAVFFPTFILFDLPSNLILRKIGPRYCLTFIVTGWGGIVLGMAFVPTWGYLTLCRVLLGALEAGFYPAVVFIITTWYTRYEVQKRLAMFYLGGSVVAAFNAIMSYGFSLLNGKRGIAGWSWIFIIQGAMSLFVGILSYFFIADFPEKNNFLTSAQTAFVLKRIEEDRGDSVPDPLTASKVWLHLKDWKIWVIGIMLMTQTMPAYFVGFFITVILSGMGWSIRDSLLLTTPPFFTAFLSAMFFAWISDKTHKRAIWMTVQVLMTIVGLFVTGYAKLGGARYFGLFLVNAGCLGCIPGLLAYSANNVTSQSQRAVSTAVIMTFSGIGGIFATTAFRQQDFPRYLPGLWATIGCQFLMLICLGLTSWHFTSQNKKIRDGKLSQLEGRDGFYYTI